jgi:hypothetical protein
MAKYDTRNRSRTAVSAERAITAPGPNPESVEAGKYTPVQRADYLYRPFVGLAEVAAWQESTGSSETPSLQAYIAWKIDQAGTYEAYLNGLSARDRRTGYSLGPTGKRPFWAADDAEYHKIVRANQRKFDGQPAVNESGKSLDDLTGGAEASTGTAAVAAYVKDNKAVLIGAAALLALVLLARKR